MVLFHLPMTADFLATPSGSGSTKGAVSLLMLKKKSFWLNNVFIIKIFKIPEAKEPCPQNNGSL